MVPLKYLSKVYYEESEVTQLEPMKWVAGVGAAGLLNMLWVPHISHSKINTICVHQFLTLVNYGCLWLGEPIPIIEMLIHWITLLPYQGVDPTEAFGGKPQEKKLTG